MLSPNQIYKQSEVNEPFSTWIDGEGNIYKERLDNGKISGKMPFLHWLNAKYRPKITQQKLVASDGSISDSLVNILHRTAENLNPEEEQEQDTNKKKNIPFLGMNPIVAYSVGALLLTTGVFLTVKYIQYKKS